MNIELGVLHDGGVMLVSDTPLPAILKHVEYYSEQRLIMLVYHCDSQEDDLMHYDIPEDIVKPIEDTSNVMIYSLFPDHEPIGYTVPLVNIPKK